MFLVGVAQILTPSVTGQTNSSTFEKAYWLRLASNAWNYYQPGFGVDFTTGLLQSGSGYPYFTDWDLGNYIQAIIDANQLGLLNTNGTWGANERFNKTLSFLENRPLSPNGVPYQWYQSFDGNPYGNDIQDPSDAGELLVALNNLRTYRPDLAGTINYIVYNRTTYGPLEQDVDNLPNLNDLYDYYAAAGFATFWPNQFLGLANQILNNIVSAPVISTFGTDIPNSTLTSEPMLLSVFNLPPNAQLENLAETMFQAEEARYNATGKYTAFSEGETGLSDVPYVYEYIVSGNGLTWVINDQGSNIIGIVPIIYFKTAVGMLAMYNSSYAESMVSYIESQLPMPANGYSEGVDENGRVITWVVANANSMIIQAAQYAVSNGGNAPTPVQSPKPTPTASLFPTPSPTATFNPSPTPTQSTQPPASTPIPTYGPAPIQSSFPNSSPSPSSTPSSNLEPTISPAPAEWLGYGLDPTFTPGSTPAPSMSATGLSPTPTENGIPSSIQPTTSPNLANKIEPVTASDYFMTTFVAIMVCAMGFIIYLKKHSRLIMNGMT